MDFDDLHFKPGLLPLIAQLYKYGELYTPIDRFVWLLGELHPDQFCRMFGCRYETFNLKTEHNRKPTEMIKLIRDETNAS